MNTPPTDSAPSDKTQVEHVPEHISQNIDSILAFYRREEKKISDSQRLLERVGGFMGRPSYLAYVLALVALWVVANGLSEGFGFTALGLKAVLIGSILPVFAVLGLGFAAFSFFTGNPMAKQNLVYAVAGSVILFGAQSIVDLLERVVR